MCGPDQSMRLTYKPFVVSTFNLIMSILYFWCVFAWSYAHIDIHNGFWYRCRLCLAVSMGPASFPKKLKNAGPSGNSWCDPSSGSNDHGCRRSLWISWWLFSRLWWIKTMIISDDFLMSPLYLYIDTIHIYTKYIYIYTKYIYIDVCSILFVHILLFTTCLRKLMAPKMSLRSSDFRTSSANSTQPCRLVGDRWLGAGGRTALGVAQCGTFALRNCWNRIMCCRDLVVALRHIWVLMVSCVKLFLDVNDRKLMVRGSCPWAKESQKHTKIASVLSQRCEGVQLAPNLLGKYTIHLYTYVYIYIYLCIYIPIIWTGSSSSTTPLGAHLPV